MKLDDEMRAAIANTLQIPHYNDPMPTIIGNLFAAGYRMGLERAATEVGKSEWCRKVGMVQRILALGGGT